MDMTLPESWKAAIGAEFEKPYFQALKQFVDTERQTETVFPPDADVLNALRLTPYDQVRVFILGQDPYHDDNQAHGLAFSVRPGIKPPPSLANIYRELKDDIPGFVPPKHGYLTSWATQGVLLLNAVLTVRAHTPNSHKGKGWETFTDAVIRAVNEKTEPVVFVLWGGYAGKKLPLIDTARHTVITSAHPSPLSAKAGFFGSRPFSKINAVLTAAEQEPIDWNLPTTVSETS
jgi:uracil-DNA glycosylase